MENFLGPLAVAAFTGTGWFAYAHPEEYEKIIGYILFLAVAFLGMLYVAPAYYVMGANSAHSHYNVTEAFDPSVFHTELSPWLYNFRLVLTLFVPFAFLLSCLRLVLKK